MRTIALQSYREIECAMGFSKARQMGSRKRAKVGVMAVIPLSTRLRNSEIHLVKPRRIAESHRENERWFQCEAKINFPEKY